jgi:crossover junction endodeoxyribonuclease RuvC
VRVLGIDPGSRFLGYGIVEESGGRLIHVGHGVIRAGGSAPLAERLEQIFSELTAAIRLFVPDAVSVEGVFTFRNARSALILGHARGVALLVAAQTGLEVHEYPPARVKRAIGAGGNGGKEAVARMVTTLLGLPEKLERSDAYDALAAAICHLNQRRVKTSSSSRGRKKGSFASLAQRLSPSYQRAPVGVAGGRR